MVDVERVVTLTKKLVDHHTHLGVADAKSFCLAEPLFQFFVWSLFP